MSEPKKLSGVAYTSFEDYRRKEGGVPETWDVTDAEAAELLLASDPVPDFPPADDDDREPA